MFDISHVRSTRRNIQALRISFLALLFDLGLWCPQPLPVLAAGAAVGGGQHENKLPLLVVGNPIVRELRGGDTDEYQITLGSGQYLHVVVDQRGIDVVVALYSPDGQQIAESDSLNGAYGPEPVSLVAEVSGSYRLRVRCLQGDAPVGRYEVRVTDLRLPTAEDMSRISAERALMQGTRSWLVGSVDSKRKALQKWEEAVPLWRAVHDLYEEALTLYWIGAARDELGEKQKALEYYNQALPLWRALGDRKAEGSTLHKVGVVYAALGEKQKALDHYTQAVPLWRAVGDQEGEATALMNMGKIYDDLGQKREAMEHYNQALPLWRALGDRDAEASTLSNIGVVYAALGEKQKALEYFTQALPLWQALGNREGETTTVDNIRTVQDDSGNRERALANYKVALTLWPNAQDCGGEAETLNALGLVYSSLGEKQTALDYYSQALALWRALGDRKEEALSLEKIEQVQNGLGAEASPLALLQDSIQRQEEALRLAELRGGKGALLNDLGMVYDDSGEKQKAIDSYTRALELARAAQDHGSEGRVLHNIGDVYNSLGDKQRALEYYTQALLLNREARDCRGEASTLNSLGMLHHSLGDEDKALDSLMRVLPLRQAVKNRAGEATTLNAIGVVYYSLGDEHKALDYYTKALRLRREVEDRRGEGTSLANLAILLQNLGERQKAQDYFDQALALFRAVADRPSEAYVLANRAALERDQGNLTKARASIEEALGIFESLRSKIASQELRTSYFATVQGRYAFYIHLLMSLHAQYPSEGYDRLALEASERGRARSLLETLAEARANIRQGVDLQLLERERALQQSLDSKSASLTRLMNGAHTAEQAETAQKEISDVLGQYQDIEGKIRTASPRYGALTQPQPLSTKAIQQHVLEPGTLLLEYALGTEQSYLWAVAPDSLTTYILPKREEIELRAREVHAKLTQTPPLSADQIYEVAAQLGQMVLGPVAPKLGHKRLAIVADGALNYIPFGALSVPSDPTATGKQPLMVDHEIVHLPSASTLAVLRRESENRPPAPKLVAVLADPVFSRKDNRLKPKMDSANGEPENLRSGVVGKPQEQDLEAEISRSQLERSAQDSGITRDGGMRRLRFSRDEANNIVQLVPNDLRLEDLDFTASKANATSPGLSQYRMVHFATHGLLDSLHPELSGIVLSLVDEQGSLTDGFLRLHDIFNLYLPADLVVLSACQTGLGKEVKGEGLVGLTRGFMYAGSLRVAVSLWSVDDQATAELMRRFYQAILKDRMRPAEALKTAQISLWKDPHWNAPYYWAAFVLQGEWR